MKSKLILHLDMDRVITDFDKAFKEISGGLDVDEYKKVHGEGGFKLVLKQGKSFWTDLDWVPGGKEVLDFAVKHYELVRILSSAGTGRDWGSFKFVQAGKLEWAAKNMPQIEKKNIVIVPFSNAKSKHSGPDRILVDDKERTIKQWTDKGGIGILHHHSDWQATLDELRAYAAEPMKLKEIVAAL